MSVVGLDIGNFKSSVGVARQGGIDIVANEYSDRITPTYVSFTNKERFQGHSAKQQEITNSQNTLALFKRLLGRKMNDPQVQNERAFYPFRLTPGPDDRIQFNIDYLNETKTFTCEQIMAMFLTKLKTIAESNLNTKVVDCVISVPCYMTDTERRALLDSAQIAGLNCLKLMNETSAVALTYGLYHSNLPEVTDKPHRVVFVDMGYTHLQASLVEFHKGKLKMVATTFDNNLGGRDFDRVLMDYFQNDFKQRYKVDAYTNIRARLRLRAECEKLKKLMSSNSSQIPLNIECFMNDIDVSGKMKREEFEKLAESLLQRVRSVLGALMKEAKLSNQDIDLVEIVGGSTRIPAVKQIVQEVFGKEPSTTLNADEACARGCTLMCAILSPNFKVKEFKIEDCQLFPITLNWKGAETDDNELEVFPQYDKIPMSKLLTIYKKEPFEIEARYRFPNNIPYNDPRIGKFYINGVQPNALGDNSEVKLKARITKNGIFEISQPQLIETIEVPVTQQDQPQAAQQQTSTEEQKEQNGDQKNEEGQQNANNDNSNAGAEESQNNEDAPMQEENQQTEANGGQAAPGAQVTKKKKTKAHDLPLTAKVPQMNRNEINLYLEQELSMIQQDRKEKERSEAKNSVEEYIYEAREKISGDYEKFIKEEDKSAFLKILDETESWLYSEDADDQEKSVYVERLQSLKNFGEPARKRFRESQERPQAMDDFGKSLIIIKKSLNQFYDNDEKYNHLDKGEVERVAKGVEEKQKWFEEKSYLLQKMKPFEDPVVLVSQIKHEKETLDKMAWSVLNKPKPKVEPPKQPEPQKAQPNGTENNGNAQQQQKPAEATMDID